MNTKNTKGLFAFDIEQMEKDGQISFVNSTQLPWKINGKDGGAIDDYKKMGIKIIKEHTDGDEIFTEVELPIGWKKEPTEHSMWSNLIDNNGNIRATIFYKAAPYDRSSFINFQTRFKIKIQRNREVENSDQHSNKKYYYCVYDDVNNLELFKTNSDSDDDWKKCEIYLIDNFPGWENWHSYWEKINL